MSRDTRDAYRHLRRQDEQRAIAGFVVAIGDILDNPDGLQTEDLMALYMFLGRNGYRMHPKGCKTPVVLSIDEEFGMLIVDLPVDHDHERMVRYVDPDGIRFKYKRLCAYSPDEKKEVYTICGIPMDYEFKTESKWYGWADFWKLANALKEQAVEREER